MIIRAALVLISVVSLASAVSACGKTGREVSSTHSDRTASAAATSEAAPKTVKTTTDHIITDNTAEHGADDLLESRLVSGSEAHKATSVLKHYYEAAARGDGASACGLLYSLFAEEIPEVYGAPPGPPSLRGKTCAVVMSKLFAQHHHELVADSRSFSVTFVRVKMLRGLAVMKFGSRPERDIPLHKEHGAWKVDALLDTAMN